MRIIINFPPGKWKQLGKSKYFIAYHGDVVSIDHTGCHKMRQRMDHGYLRVWLNITPGKTTAHNIHRLVAKCFKPNPKNLPIVNHLDHNKLNNHGDNLKWSTHSDNSKHSYLNNNRQPSRTCAIPDTTVLEIRKLFRSGKHSQRKLAVIYGVTQGHISDLVNNKKRTNI